MLETVILHTELPGIERHAQGKVRDVYRVDGRLLIVATDRISAFDYILPTGIPDKGRVLTQLSIFWFDFLRDVTPTHFLTANVDEYPAALRPFREPTGRPLDAGEARANGGDRMRGARLSGGLRLEGIQERKAPSAAFRCPPGLRESDRLPEPIFTPSTKATSGPRREHFVRDDVLDGGRGAGRAPARPHAARSIRARRPMRRPRA